MNQTQDALSNIVVYSKYAKYIPSLKRRETWTEICYRYLTMMEERYPQLSKEIWENGQFILDKKVLMSMRAAQFSGPAIKKNNSRVYNCAFLPVDHHLAFSEIMFLLLGGTGVGYSVQQHHIDNLPEILKPVREKKYLVGDSIEGWADAVKALMKAYFGLSRTRPLFDFSDVRQKGTRLITAGGKAPGPEPLKNCLHNIELILLRKENGTKLTDEEVHDIICHIADAVLAGGIRRAALISLFSAKSKRMRNCKSSAIPSTLVSKKFQEFITAEGITVNDSVMFLTVEQDGVVYKDIPILRDKDSGKFWDLEQYEATGTFGWWVCNPQRGRANNSAFLLRHKVSKAFFMDLWKQIEDSHSGEPGIYLSNDKDYGTNPCCEISLRPFTFCNLTEINARTLESKEDFLERCRVASFFGTLQAGITDFHYLRDIWIRNTRKDALIGVGMTGVGNGKIMKLREQYPEILNEGAYVVLDTNEIISKIIGINKAARTTTMKPSGTTSCVLSELEPCFSGIHAGHDEYYIRNIQCAVGDDLFNYFMKYHPQLIKIMDRMPKSAVIGIPQKASEGSILRNNETALQLLERVKAFNLEWVKAGHRSGENTNNVSATISIKPEEWKEVGEWMWKNKETYNGLSVLDYDGGTYLDAPFQTCTKEIYEEKLSYLVDIDLTKISEEDDNTNLTAEAACAGGACEVTM